MKGHDARAAAFAWLSLALFMATVFAIGVAARPLFDGCRPQPQRLVIVRLLEAA